MLSSTYASVSKDAWPSSEAFDLIASALSDEKERKDAIKKGGAIFAFTLKNSEGEQKDWYIDLKEVGKGLAPVGKKSSGMLSMILNGHVYTSTSTTLTSALLLLSSQPHTVR